MFKYFSAMILMGWMLQAFAMTEAQAEEGQKMYHEVRAIMQSCEKQLPKEADNQTVVNCYLKDMYELVKKGNYMAAIVIADSFELLGDSEEAKRWHAYLLKSDSVPDEIKAELKDMKN